jgi:hypothetical protein
MEDEDFELKAQQMVEALRYLCGGPKWQHTKHEGQRKAIAEVIRKYAPDFPEVK